MNTTPILQFNNFRLDNDIKDTLEKEPENDDLIVSVIIIKAAPLNVFVQDKRANAVFNDTHEEEINEV